MKGILISMFLACQIAGFSQEPDTKHAIKIQSFVKKDRVLLRWAPTTALSWEYCNQYGYTIERYTMIRDTLFITTPEKKVFRSSFKPAPQAEWEQYILQSNDNFAAIAAQCLYGKSLEIESENTSIYQMINKAKETENRFGFALYSADRSVKVAQLSALWWSDSTIKKNEKYLYRVFSNTPTAILRSDTAVAFIDAKVISSLPLIRELRAKFGYKAVQLEWDSRVVSDYYSAWQIEKSTDGKKWMAVNKSPYIPVDNTYKKDGIISYGDTLGNSGKVFYYRIAGFTTFGELGPYSLVSKGMGKMEVPVKPFINETKMMDKANLYISWEFPEQYNELINGFELSVASKANAKYKLLGKYKSSMRNTIVKIPFASNYLVIKALGKDSAYYSALPKLFLLEDDTPPKPPIGFSGKIDTLGKVFLKWNKNKEVDFYGYRLFVSNSLHEEFSNTYPIIKDTTFLDSVSIKTLTNYIYYKIAALDNHYNQSALSEPIKLKKPDKIPPSTPVFIDLIASDTSVFLSWALSNSKDVAKYELYRTEKDSAEMVIAVFKGTKINQSTFLDKRLKKSILYQYHLIAIDEDSNRSAKSIAIKAELIDNKVKPIPTDINSKVDLEKGFVSLSWKYPSMATTDKYLIYRGENSKRPSLYKSVSREKYEFIDQNITLNTKYVYKIRVQHTDGGSSPISSDIVVKY